MTLLVGQIRNILLVNRLVSLTLRGEMRVGLRAELIFLLPQLFLLELLLAAFSGRPCINGECLPGAL